MNPRGRAGLWSVLRLSVTRLDPWGHARTDVRGLLSPLKDLNLYTQSRLLLSASTVGARQPPFDAFKGPPWAGFVSWATVAYRYLLIAFSPSHWITTQSFWIAAQSEQSANLDNQPVYLDRQPVCMDNRPVSMDNVSACSQVARIELSPSLRPP